MTRIKRVQTNLKSLPLKQQQSTKFPANLQNEVTCQQRSEKVGMIFETFSFLYYLCLVTLGRPLAIFRENTSVHPNLI